MSHDQYIVLQDLNAERRSARLKTRGGTPDDALQDAPPELLVTHEPLSEPQASEARCDPNTLGVARVLPLQLVQPVPAANRPPNQPPNQPQASAADIDGISWGLDALGVSHSPFTGEGVTVAVLDTGIDTTHPTFADPALSIEQRNFTEESAADRIGHGTHCAATLFGRAWEHEGKRCHSGVAPGITRALVGKVIGEGAGTDALINAITWAHTEGAQVISLSLGYDHAGQLDTLCQRYPKPKATSELLAIYLENVRLFDTLLQHISVPVQGRTSPLVIAAAGNESDADGAMPYRISVASPASSVGVLAVGAVGRHDSGVLSVAPFSNTQVDVVAPGVDIPSAAPAQSLAVLSGTSVACPHVAGVSALHWQRLMSMGLPQSSSVARSFLTAGATRQSIAAGAATADVGVGVVQAPV